MQLRFRLMTVYEQDLALSLLKSAAQRLKDKGIDQWSHWLNPDQNKIDWVKEGFDLNQFYAVENLDQELVGMVRLLKEDLLYWGVQSDEARYIHSLVVKSEYSNQNLGSIILSEVAKRVRAEGITLLRLDCNAANKWLCSYYEKQGFTKAGEVQMSHSLNNLYEKKLA